jgi:hypothetical protein
MSGYVAARWAPVAPAVDARRRETCLDSSWVSVGFSGQSLVASATGWDAKPPGPRIPSLETSKGRSLTMLWTILIIVVIVALALFIFRRVRR